MTQGRDTLIYQCPSLMIYGHIGFDTCVTNSEEVTVPGGAAYYAAIAAAQVSRSVGIVTVIGRDFPLARLRSLQIDTRGVVLRDGRSATFYQKYGDEGQVVKFHYRLNVCQELAPVLIPADYIEALVFFIATAPPFQQREALEWMVHHKIKPLVAIDTTLAFTDQFQSLLKEYTNYIDVVFSNDEEYLRLRSALADGITVVVKRGAEGASLRENGFWTDVSAPSIDAVHSTTGAGDVLAGAFLAGIAAGDTFKGALTKGVELATKSVTMAGVDHLRGHASRQPPNPA